MAKGRREKVREYRPGFNENQATGRIQHLSADAVTPQKLGKKPADIGTGKKNAKTRWNQQSQGLQGGKEEKGEGDLVAISRAHRRKRK